MRDGPYAALLAKVYAVNSSSQSRTRNSQRNTPMIFFSTAKETTQQTALISTTGQGRLNDYAISR